MICKKTVLRIIRDQVEPDEAQGTEIVLEHGIMQRDAVLHIGTCTDYVMTLGTRSLLKFYNLDKLKADGIYVHRRPYGGSGTIYGPKDVLFSLYINKSAFIDGHDVSAEQAYAWFTLALCAAVNEIGVKAVIDETETRRQEDGVCAHLQGRSEIRAVKGDTRMVASVFREDELGFYMRGMMIVSADWAKVYDYLISPTDPMYPVDSIEMQLGEQDITDEVIEAVISQFSTAFDHTLYTELSHRERAAVKALKGRYGVI